MTHPDDVDADLIPFRRMAKGELDRYAVEKRFIHGDGHHLWARLNLSLVRDAEGRPAYEIAVIEDISDRKAQQENLREIEMRQRELLATLDLGASMARDPFDDRIRFWSAGCERLYGWTSGQAMGRPAHDLLRTAFPVSRAEIQAALERDDEWTGDLRQRRRDGAEIVVSAHKALRRDEDGRPLAVLEALADVTAQREAEKVLARDKAELERLVEERSRELDESRARAAHAERMQALGQLAGGIAHDVNNVLQAVQSGVKLIEKRASGTEEIGRIADMINEATARGSNITRRLLAFSRGGELRAEALDPAALLGGLREVLRSTLAAGVEVRVEAPAGLPSLLADKGQLETVLINLATNARDAMPEGGVLTFAAALATREDAADVSLPPGPHVRLSVMDTGAGMPPEVLARVTEPFFTTKAEGEGTGLGLALAKGFAEQSGGGLPIESAPGRGTTVALWFPLAPATASPPSGKATEASAAARGRRARILLVDDDPMVRDLTALQLWDGGFVVLPVSSGAAALALLDAGEAVDLLISDLKMADMDGLTLIGGAQLRRKGLPAILLTGSPDTAAEQAAGQGGFDMLRKPVTPEQLAERLAKALEGAKAGTRGR
jgi:PAS domain S-box-containing protein